MLKNYHSHTERCGHAWGTDDEFVQAAIEAGFCVLGFSEHSPWPFVDGYQEIDSRQRITMEQLDHYIQDMQALKEKYKDRIEIRIGLECEYFPQYFDWLKTVKPRLDYLLLGVHCADHDEHLTHYYARSTKPEQVQEYLRCALAGMESGLFAYLAHPDLICYKGDHATYRKHMRRLCQEAKSCGVPLEMNLLGLWSGRHYPDMRFWALAAEEGCQAVLGWDAHAPEQLCRMDAEQTMRRAAKNLGIELLDTVTFRSLG